ncbi:hypothetical protein [sulfur-oxidizing endosymbiont of Gigantopelta aegis]|uniref:hypothetical protein n=1 Tax=sulfur-oxidizing endosymbiont of Gigantopelta aegis TaxID=2794934 RepID=UPI0018DB693C|nr:hypothetical protein [sulfur-oxidizing endosymbiont of Gigantopelta aegis]
MLLAVSHAEQQSVLMENFSQQYSLTQSINHSLQITWLNKTYEVQLFPLNDMGSKENTMTLVISDITQELEAIDIMTLKTFNTGLLGLLISEILLFAILWLPMRKILTHSESTALIC